MRIRNGILLAAMVFANAATICAQSVIDSETPSVALSSSMDASAQLTLTASVSTDQGTGVPCGTIQFVDESTLASLGWTNAAKPWIKIDRLPPGRHRLRADYSGCSDYLPVVFQPSQSELLIENVLSVPEVALLSSNNPSLPGQLVTLTAVVKGPGGVPAGTVRFRDGRRVIASVALDHMGTASFTTSALAEGSRAITAEFQGDSLNAPAASKRLSQDVGVAIIRSSHLLPHD